MSPRSPEEVLTSIAAAVNAHDLDTFVALHEPNAAVVVPPDGLVRASGHAAIRRALEPLFARAPSVKVDLLGMLRCDDLAMSHTHFAVTLTADDGERVENAGVGTVVSRQQQDGSWHIVFDYPLRVWPTPPPSRNLNRGGRYASTTVQILGELACRPPGAWPAAGGPRGWSHYWRSGGPITGGKVVPSLAELSGGWSHAAGGRHLPSRCTASGPMVLMTDTSTTVDPTAKAECSDTPENEPFENEKGLEDGPNQESSSCTT